MRTDVIHTYPANDLRPHEVNGKPCWCNPSIEEDGQHIIHNSMDQREKYEIGELRLN